MKHFKYKHSQYQIIAGADEAGRGSWAGPIVGAAIILDFTRKIPENIKIADSKILTPREREKSFAWLQENTLAFEITVISPEEIDTNGLGRANILVLQNSLERLKITPEFALIDGFNLPNLKIPHERIIHGDKLFPVISAASILAKVYRDNLMREFAKEFPEYFFEKHKGYGTKLHQEQIKKNGVCAIHRQSFKPIKNFVS